MVLTLMETKLILATERSWQVTAISAGLREGAGGGKWADHHGWSSEREPFSNDVDAIPNWGLQYYTRVPLLSSTSTRSAEVPG